MSTQQAELINPADYDNYTSDNTNYNTYYEYDSVCILCNEDEYDCLCDIMTDMKNRKKVWID